MGKFRINIWIFHPLEQETAILTDRPITSDFVV